MMSDFFYLCPSLHSLDDSAADNPRNKFLLNYTVYHENKLWEIRTFEVKDCSALQFFNNKIKHRCSDRCLCQICSNYLVNVGYF